MGINVYLEENREKLSKIIKYEWEITEAVMNGHRPHMGDEFKDKRNLMKKLRQDLGIKDRKV